MDKAKPFDDYFTDEKLTEVRRARLLLMRATVHELYPDVQERVSYAMPGFYPKRATKANQQLFMFMANKNWLGLYGTDGLSADELGPFERYDVTAGKGSLHVPYDMPEAPFKKLLQFVMRYNFERHGLDLVH